MRWWVRKSWLYKASGCWPFYSSHTKGLQKHHRHTLTHTQCFHTSWNSGWRSDIWCVNDKIKHLKVLQQLFLLSVSILCETIKWEKQHKSHSKSMTRWKLPIIPNSIITTWNSDSLGDNRVKEPPESSEKNKQNNCKFHSASDLNNSTWNVMTPSRIISMNYYVTCHSGPIWHSYALLDNKIAILQMWVCCWKMLREKATFLFHPFQNCLKTQFDQHLSSYKYNT